MKTGGVLLIIGMARFIFSADSHFGLTWHCLLYRDFECDVTMPDASPVLTQIGGACFVIGLAVYLYSVWAHRQGWL